MIDYGGFRESRVYLRLVCAMLLALSASPAGAETYYVRMSGDDAQDGLSPQTAFATISTAGEVLQEPGDRVIVGPGTYNEGNIGPRGNGSPDDPILFQGDPSGLSTGDLAAPVTIVPPNVPVPPSDEDNRTGFLLFGKHDVVIEGFTIEGAADAGIQVRPHFSTGTDSTRIIVRDNVIRNGGQRGIHIIGAGDATVTDNTVRGNRDAGVALIGGTSIDLRPFVAGNVIEENQVGIALEKVSDATIENNFLTSNQRAIGIVASDRVTIRENEMTSRHDSMSVRSGGTRPTRHLHIVGNLIRGGTKRSIISVAGSINYEMNRLLDEVAEVFTLTFHAAPDTVMRLLGNEFGRVELHGGAELELIGNNCQRLDAFVSGGITATDNSFTRRVTLHASGVLSVSRNRGSWLEARSERVSFTDNEIEDRVELIAEAATMTDNRCGYIFLFRLKRPTSDEPVDDSESSFVVERNRTATFLQIGQNQRHRLPASRTVVRHNTAGGIIRVYANGPAEVTNNEAAGIACVLFEPNPDLTLLDNTSSGSASSGLVVVGARDVLVEGNVASNNTKHGLAMRRTRKATVTRNTFWANRIGGISVERTILLGGDCNDDAEVTVDEVVVGIAIALQRLELDDCEAIDFDGNGVVTIDELVRAVAGTLGTIAPEGTDEPGEIRISSNRIEDNLTFGINIEAPASVSAVENIILRNGGIGIAARVNQARRAIGIFNNWVGSSGVEGILLRGTSEARIENNLIFSNGGAGILLRDAPGVSIVNNLIYDNSNDGVAIGVGTNQPSSDALLSNNTIYANHGWAVTIGTAGAPSVGSTILNNILDRNELGGIAADLGSLAGLTIGFNLNNDGYGNGVTPSVSDFQASPRFVDVDGPDDVLGAAGFEDDDFHLEAASAAVDSGSTTAAELGITGTAVTDLAVDEGIVDLGFHYGATLPESSRNE